MEKYPFVYVFISFLDVDSYPNVEKCYRTRLFSKTLLREFELLESRVHANKRTKKKKC